MKPFEIGFTACIIVYFKHAIFERERERERDAAAASARGYDDSLHKGCALDCNS